MDGSWATVVPAAASNALPRPSTAAGASTRLTARGLAGRLFAALRQGVHRQTPVAAETLEADACVEETCRTSTQMDLEAGLQPQRESRESRQVNSGAKEDEELELLLADIAAQTALLQQEMREGGLRKCEAEVQISHTELQKQKIARQLLEEQLKTLECQLLDSTEKEEIRSLLKDLAAQTSACAKAQEQVQKALKDMEELGAENGAVKVDEGMESTTQLQDMLVELQPSNDAVKADELKTLLRNFALYTAVNLKAEAAIQAVLNDLEALKASKDLEETQRLWQLKLRRPRKVPPRMPQTAARNRRTEAQGEAQAAGAKDDLLERIELHEAMLNCESSKALGDCQRVPDSGMDP
ncbi:unnamed protein product [Cladocopium goreaui]|uniref:Uncharacterized protein n=1 Tax=Cladocopium goreaui TaxID=2562237 RepID=A0A9P1DR94_9DINO|nr:unnamed protein product [Cladocopium goreaui]